ncbi:MAG: DUF488 domain-containing protein [Bosea sp. (in: a-proteobacteria)]|uniref:DUF488 domain-containing protein n=1 Tax=Bosea sp. (in: a-proteobacteria) TaxID=1871050 RepID=UPI0027344ABB|nr:DUF488 domain-containing protein [Bosea sp. (in: a-proteobacteria)]MDP3255252.1 DUF488 domain-containing protein [Bosea sp. (in: a-proteobacteria)]MDP3319766.1 DUF488 domain-containing protein [Bosea sp. (in: a-proteobacteria)]
MAVVYTIGYEGTDIDRFVQTLQHVGVEVLADVRAVTVSRKKGFSKNGLRERLNAAGIAYLHFPELGDPKPGREAAREGRIADFQRIYGEHLGRAEAQSDLISLGEVVDGRSTCLMCFERDPKVCHRTIVAKALAERGAAIFDLFGDEPGRYVRHASKLPNGNPRQGPSAAE